MKAIWRDLLIIVVVALVVYLGANLVTERAVVDGSSMVPSLQNNQRLIILTAAYYFGSPQRGDVIIIHPPVDPQKMWVKRLIGLPGDTIEIKGGKVYVNDVALYEPYINASPEYSFSLYTVPPDHYFVLGDNRNNSTDSHYNWTVTRENIVGKAWLRYWPFNQMGIVRSYDLTAELQKASAVQAGAPIPATVAASDSN